MAFDINSAKEMEVKPKAKFDLGSAKPVEPSAPAPKAEADWFQPGSKSEAAVRGFSQAATLGYGDEIQAALRSLFGDQKYTELRDQERTANTRSAQENPASYTAGGVVAALPAGAAGIGKTVGQTALRSGALGAVSGVGGSEATDVAGMAKDAATGAAVQGTVGTVAKVLPKIPVKAAGTVAPLLKDPTTTGAAIGALGAGVSGGNVIEGAVLGGLAGRAGRGPIGQVSTKLSKWASTPKNVKPVNLPGALTMTGTNATGLALRNMAGVQARQVVTEGNQKIQEAVNAGQPAYAAVFQQLNNNPAYRVASEKVVKMGPDSGPDTEEDLTEEED